MNPVIRKREGIVRSFFWIPTDTLSFEFNWFSGAHEGVMLYH